MWRRDSVDYDNEDCDEDDDDDDDDDDDYIRDDDIVVCKCLPSVMSRAGHGRVTWVTSPALLTNSSIVPATTALVIP